MGGRGSSNPRGGGDGFEKRGATSVADGNMGSIDLSGSPLRYGKADKALDGQRRVAVEGFENRYRGAKVEYGATFDANGMTTELKRGGKGSVRTSVTKYNSADTFSHIHPRQEGILGGTFSQADLSNFSTYGVKTVRAAAKEGTYSISKGKNFDAQGFRQYFTSEYSRVTREGNAAIRALNKTVSARTTAAEYESYTKKWKKETNRQLVALHNVLIGGQSKFGYTYTLERSE